MSDVTTTCIVCFALESPAITMYDSCDVCFRNICCNCVGNGDGCRLMHYNLTATENTSCMLCFKCIEQLTILLKINQ